MEESMNTAFGSTGLQMDLCGKYHSMICLKQLVDIFYAFPYSNQTIIILFDALICVAFIISHASRTLTLSVRSLLTLSSLVWNGCLGLVYFGFGLLMLGEKLRLGLDLHPLNEWIVLLTQGVTWVLISLVPGGSIITGTKLKLWSLFVFLFSGFLSVSSLFDFKQKNELSFTNLLDVCSLVGAILLLLCSFEQSRKVKHHNDSISLINDSIHVNHLVTPFAKAGFFSRMTFHWLHSLMKKGYKKPLEEQDIPCLSEEDLALNCYSLFEKERQKKSRTIFWSIVSCHQKEIWITGLFALLKVLMLSSGPMLLKEFVNVSMGKEAFKYEGYALACGLFMSKLLESVSQRQWYFRSKRLGLQLRSLLSAAIFRKQLKLSNLARLDHSSGVIMNYVTVDAYRIGEFPFWFHKTWSTILQLCIALVILYNAVGLATISAMIVIVLTVACNAPLAKLQHKYQSKLMISQDSRLKALSEALIYMKVLKLYAWETHFKKVVDDLRGEECKWLSAYQLRRSYNSFLFWSSPVLVSCLTFLTCYFLDIPLDAVNVFTFVATLRLVQDPVREIPDVIGVVIQAKVGFARLLKFLDAPELDSRQVRSMNSEELKQPIILKSCSFSWDVNTIKPTLSNINLNLKAGDKVAICGEVGSGKSTLLAAILGEVPKIVGEMHVGGNIAYVSQNAWIQSGTVKDNILFGSPMNREHYQETLEKCSLLKDLEMLPFGDLTQIGERGVNLSGGQKQRLQLARALYQDADIYLLDDPFSAVDAHTSSSLFSEYVMKALAKKTVLLVTHQVDFLPDFNSILLMSEGEIMQSGSYNDLTESSIKFKKLVDAHKDTVGSSNAEHFVANKKHKNLPISQNITNVTSVETSIVDQLIKKEERETGDTGLKPYLLYLNQDKGLLYASISTLCHVIFVAGQILQNSWMAANVENNEVSMLKLISVYLTIGLSTTIFLLFRSLFVVTLGVESSKSIFSQLLNSLFRAPLSFFDSTPLGRILSRVSSDMNIVDLDVPFILIFSFSASINVLSNIGVLTFITKEVLLVSVPLVFLTVKLQKYYLASAKELMRIDGTTRSVLANHLSESLSGSITIRAFKEEDRFFAKTLELIDKNASPYFHNFAGNEWLIHRLEMVGAAILSSSALFMVLLPNGTFSAGFVGMAISYGLSLNMSLVFAIQNQCTLANNIVSVERLNQYMHVPSEAPEIIDTARPDPDWPSFGTVEIDNLQIRYRPDSPLVLRGISCKFEGGHRIGIVGRTGSGKTTLISALFRLVEPCSGRILIDGLDITTIGLHDLRQRIGIIPQDPTLFYGSVRYNLDPLGQYTDLQIWEVLEKCQLGDIVHNKEQGLNSIVVEDGSNWSMGQRQLFCLGRALLKRSRILVLDEATASIDNTTDAILQKTIRNEFAECTVITVAHRIPTVMDCTMVMAMSDGVMVEYDEPKRLMQSERSLFGELVKEYWSHSATSSD